MIVADVTTHSSDAVSPKPSPAPPSSGEHLPAIQHHAIQHHAIQHHAIQHLPAIQHHASCVSAWLRHVLALPLPSSTVVAVAFAKVPPLSAAAAAPLPQRFPQVDLLPTQVFLEVLPPLLQLAHDVPVSLFATSAKANSQVTTAHHTSHVTRHTSHVTRDRCTAYFMTLQLLSSTADNIPAAAAAAVVVVAAAATTHCRTLLPLCQRRRRREMQLTIAL